MSGSNILVSGTGIELPPMIGDLYVPVTLNSAAGTTPQLMVTGAPGYLLTRLFVEVDASCTVSGGGMVSINFTDTGSGLSVSQYRVYIPATFTAPTVPTGPQLASTGTGYWFRARTPGSTLTVSLNTALTAGTIRVAANYALTTIDS